jgi:hypothetical protein
MKGLTGSDSSAPSSNARRISPSVTTPTSKSSVVTAKAALTVPRVMAAMASRIEAESAAKVTGKITQAPTLVWASDHSLVKYLYYFGFGSKVSRKKSLIA